MSKDNQNNFNLDKIIEKDKNLELKNKDNKNIDNESNKNNKKKN